MIDADGYAKSIKLPNGATDESLLRIKVAEVRRIAEAAYIRGALDAMEPIRKADADMPEFFRGIFGR